MERKFPSDFGLWLMYWYFLVTCLHRWICFAPFRLLACLLASFRNITLSIIYVSPFARRLYWRADACASQTLGSLQQDLISTLTCNNQNVARATYLSTTWDSSIPFDNILGPVCDKKSQDVSCLLESCVELSLRIWSRSRSMEYGAS